MALWVQGLTQVGTSLLSYQEQKNKTKYAKKVQDYQNKLKALSAAFNSNTAVTNEVIQTQQLSRVSKDIQNNLMSNLGAVTTAAASAGVTGNSVTRTLLKIQQQAGAEEKDRQSSLQALFRQADNQRSIDDFNYKNSLDQTRITRPSFAATMLGGLANFGAENSTDIGKQLSGLFAKPAATGSPQITSTPLPPIG